MERGILVDDSGVTAGATAAPAGAVAIRSGETSPAGSPCEMHAPERPKALTRRTRTHKSVMVFMLS